MKIQSVGVNESIVSRNNSQKSHIQKQPSFGRAWEEHISWGANYIKDKGKTNFKLFSFPDAKAVFVEVAEKAVAGVQNIRERIVQVLGTAGAAGLTITNIMSKDEHSAVYPMEHKGDGIYTVNGVAAKPNDKYRYVVIDKDSNINIVKDPYAKKQENIHGWSSVYNSDNYKWVNTKWLDGKDSRRISRDPKDEKFHGLAKLRIEEINIPTFTKEGDFKSAKTQIDKIAADGIANAIEIMPVENTYSKQWGYDGVDKFAVNEKLGSQAELKELIDYAHGKGLNVIMDMVPNHMGQDGDYLSQTGPYESGTSPWGTKFNYEYMNSKYVRDFMANAALWWANEFKVDGIRFDMTKETASDYLLKQIADELNEHNPNVFLIAEDARENKLSVTRYDDSTNPHKEKIESIDMLVDLIGKGVNTTPHAIGFDSEWDFPFMHALKDVITHNDRTSLTSLDETMKNSNHRVKYILSHDEIGNADGTRLIPKIMAQYLNYFGNIDGCHDADRGQKAARLSHELFVGLLSGKTEDELKTIQQNHGMRYIYDKTTLTNALKAALAKSRLASGSVMTVPGPKMFFQGEEYADMSYFKFFRDFSPEFNAYPPNAGIKDQINAEKGYNVANEYAMKDSVMNQVKPSGEFIKAQAQMLKYNQDLAKLIDEHEALQNGELKSVYSDHNNMIHIHSVEKDGEKLLIFKNYADNFHNGTYSTQGFPQNEKYVEIFNSDDVIYGGSGRLNSGRDITADNQNLKLAANTMIILKRV